LITLLLSNLQGLKFRVIRLTVLLARRLRFVTSAKEAAQLTGKKNCSYGTAEEALKMIRAHIFCDSLQSSNTHALNFLLTYL
jgi:hypothetical protein